MAVAKIILSLVKLWESISYRLGVVASTFALIMGLFVFTEVIARRLFYRTTYIVYDVVEFLFAGIIFLGLAETYRARAHIRIEMLESRLPSFARKLLLEIIFPLIIVVYLSFLVTRATSFVLASYQAGSKTVSAVGVTLWPAQMLMPIGLFVFAVLVFLYFLHGCWAILKGRGTSPPDGAGLSQTDEEGETSNGAKWKPK